jgi:hypothetical protein
MNKEEYDAYVERVNAFMKREGLSELICVSNMYPYFSRLKCMCCGGKPGDRYDMVGRPVVSRGVIEWSEYEVCIDCVEYATYGYLEDVSDD